MLFYIASNPDSIIFFLLKFSANYYVLNAKYWPEIAAPARYEAQGRGNLPARGGSSCPAIPARPLEKARAFPAFALDDRGKFLALGESHADAPHRDVGDLVRVAVFGDPPIDADGRLVAVGESYLALNDPCIITFRSCTEDFELLAGIAVETPGIRVNDIVLEELD